MKPPNSSLPACTRSGAEGVLVILQGLPYLAALEIHKDTLEFVPGESGQAKEPTLWQSPRV